MTEQEKSDHVVSPASMTSAQIQEAIWRGEVELDNLHRKEKENRRTSRVIRITMVFAVFFCLVVTALNSGSFIAYVSGAGMFVAGLIFFLSFMPNSEFTEEKARVEGELYVLRNSWSQSLLKGDS